MKPRLTTNEVAAALGIERPASSHVKLDDAAVRAFAERVRAYAAHTNYSRATWSDPKFWNTEAVAHERSQFFAIGNAINFRFWRLEGAVLQPASGRVGGELLRGSMYMWRCLRRAQQRGELPLLEASFLSRLTFSEFDAIFVDDDGCHPLAVARDERIANLRDLGERLLEDWKGQFYELILASEGSLVRYAALASRFRAFDDPVLKLTMVNAILHVGSGVAEFDADPIPGIDYHLLKQLLRHGVLQPSSDLHQKLASLHLLSSEEGLALRRAALYAFIEISRLSGVSGELIDNMWWQNRERCTELNPICTTSAARECPFLDQCKRLTEYGLPLEETRYY